MVEGVAEKKRRLADHGRKTFAVVKRCPLSVERSTCDYINKRNNSGTFLKRRLNGHETKMVSPLHNRCMQDERYFGRSVCTVEVNKKFMFRFRFTIVLRKQLHSFRYAVLWYGVNRSTLHTMLPKTIGCEV